MLRLEIGLLLCTAPQGAQCRKHLPTQEQHSIALGVPFNSICPAHLGPILSPHSDIPQSAQFTFSPLSRLPSISPDAFSVPLNAGFPYSGPVTVTGSVDIAGNANAAGSNPLLEPTTPNPKTSRFKTLRELESELLATKSQLLEVKNSASVSMLETKRLNAHITMLQSELLRDKRFLAKKVDEASEEVGCSSSDIQDLSDSLSGMKLAQGEDDESGRKNHENKLLGLISEYAHRLGMEMLGFQVERYDLEKKAGMVSISMNGLPAKLSLPSYLNVNSQLNILREKHLEEQLKLKLEIDQLRTLANIGAAVRIRFLEKMRCNLWDSPEDEACKDHVNRGTLAIEELLGTGDRMLFECGYIKPEDSHYESMALTSKNIYGVEHCAYPWRSHIICQILDMTRKVKLVMRGCRRQPSMFNEYYATQIKLLATYNNKGDVSEEDFLQLESTRELIEAAASLSDMVMEEANIDLATQSEVDDETEDIGELPLIII